MHWLLENASSITEGLLTNTANRWRTLGIHVLLLVRLVSPQGVFTQRAKLALLTTVPVGSRIRDEFELVFSDDYEFLQKLEATGEYDYDQISIMSFLLVTVYKAEIRPADARVAREYGERAAEITRRPS